MAGNAAHWRDLPEAFGKWTAVHARFRRWSHKGVWERLFHALAATPDFEYVLIDSTISKVHADARGAKGGLKLPRWAARAADCRHNYTRQTMRRACRRRSPQH